MIRARFRANPIDPRPVSWPIRHPYWQTGFGDDYTIIVAYAANEAEIRRLWPEAMHIDAEEVDGYVFTDRLPRPAWLDAQPGAADGEAGS